MIVKEKNSFGMLLVVVFVVLAGISIACVKALTAPKLVKRQYLYIANDSIKTVDSNLEHTYNVLSRNGEKLTGPLSASVDSNMIAYWSSTDSAIATKTSGGKWTWYELPKEMLCQGNQVESVWTVGKKYVMINIMDTNYRPIKVILMDTADAKWRVLDGAIQSKSDLTSNSHNIAVIDKNHHIEVRSLDTAETILSGLISDNSDWSFDFDTQTVYWLKRATVFSKHLPSGKIRNWELPGRYRGNGLMWQPDLDELWVSVGASFSMTGFAIYSAEGKYIGSVEDKYGPYYKPPQALTNTTSRSLDEAFVLFAPKPPSSY